MIGGCWNSVVTTDQDGIYDVTGLPPDNYTLRLLDVPPNQVAEDRTVRKQDLIKMVRLRLDIYTEWDGSIEGIVKDVSGKPTHVFVELQHPDGTSVIPEISGFTETKEGHFRFTMLPVGGRYVLMVNPPGPREDSPYSPLYYPSAIDREQAHIFEIKPENQHMTNVDLTVRRLSRQALRVQAAGPNGHEISGASIHVAYEHLGLPIEVRHAYNRRYGNQIHRRDVVRVQLATAWPRRV